VIGSTERHAASIITTSGEFVKLYTDFCRISVSKFVSGLTEVMFG
jgi:hypothetical protein